ncbi:MAG: SDR family oxidoreductase [Verrucomicrobia bacterium]|nr:SDR family oxidoreductase [Verrucomicrobiota bacterium]
MGWSLVTGGAIRLGAAICRTLAKSGKNVVIHYRSQQAAAESLREELLSLGVQAEILQGDFSTALSTQDFLDAYTARFAGTDLFIHNVGNYQTGSLLDGDAPELFQINVNSALQIIKALKSTLRQILCLGMAGACQASAHAPLYNLTKCALLSLVRSLAKELAPMQISVNMVSPGYLENSVELPSALPWGRPGTLDEVTAAIRFLLDSSYITGQNIEIAGGVRL